MCHLNPQDICLSFLNQYDRVHTITFLIFVGGLKVSKEDESQLQTDYLHQLTGVWSDRRLSVQKEFHILLQTLRNTPQKGSPELPQLLI